MNESNFKVLVIDDSSTIRRLVDNELSSTGYQVLLSPTAEDGIERAVSEMPDLILLDHQLPGTTGYDVCCQLLEDEQLAQIPVVISSTLRKKAYVEYVDAPNVVDMLPKPYSSELLLTTVKNALETAKMIVQSQQEGSAVPEIVGELAEADLWGSFDLFGLREILDLLNCSGKKGVLEIQMASGRVLAYTDRGRIQAVTASGVDASEIAAYMPDSLKELAPFIKVSVAGRNSSAIDSLVELLDNKMLDPRLLKKLLRLQAAFLMRRCFTGELRNFRFEGSVDTPPLFRKLPLEISLTALLVEGTANCDLAELPDIDQPVEFTRRNIRGQNLDRAGLSAMQMKILGMLSRRGTLDQFSDAAGATREEVYRILCGFEQADLLERVEVQNTSSVVVVTSDPAQVQQLKGFFDRNQNRFSVRVVSDWLALGLVLRRGQVDAVIVGWEEGFKTRLQQLQNSPAWNRCKPHLVGLCSDQEEARSVFEAGAFDSVVPAPFDDTSLLDALGQLETESPQDAGEPDSSSQQSQQEQPADVEAPLAVGASDSQTLPAGGSNV
ncbi:MAG: response regulator [Planctomycetota bacterium]